MQDDVKAVELAIAELHRQAAEQDGFCVRHDGPEAGDCAAPSVNYEGNIEVDKLLRVTLAALQERCERLEGIARRVIAWRDAGERGPDWAGMDALKDDARALVTPEHSGGYPMSPEDTDPAKMEGRDES